MELLLSIIITVCSVQPVVVVSHIFDVSLTFDVNVNTLTQLPPKLRSLFDIRKAADWQQ